MITKEKAKKLLSLSFHNRLTNTLHVCYNATTTKKCDKAYERLRDSLEPIFAYVEIFELHQDHLVEIAEVLQGIQPEADDIVDYTFHILEYLQKQMKTLSIRRAEAQKAYDYAQHTYEPGSGELLDAQYVAQTYQQGYYAGQYTAYKLLYGCLNGLVDYVNMQKGA